MICIELGSCVRCIVLIYMQKGSQTFPFLFLCLVTKFPYKSLSNDCQTKLRISGNCRNPFFSGKTFNKEWQIFLKKSKLIFFCRPKKFPHKIIFANKQEISAGNVCLLGSA